MVSPSVGVMVPPFVEVFVVVVPAIMLAGVCAASLFVSVFVVLVSVFMVFLLVSFCGGVCSGCRVSRAACPRLHVWSFRCWCVASR